MPHTIKCEIHVQLPNGNLMKIRRDLDMPENESEAPAVIAAWLEAQAEELPGNMIFDGA